MKERVSKEKKKKQKYILSCAKQKSRDFKPYRKCCTTILFLLMHPWNSKEINPDQSFVTTQQKRLFTSTENTICIIYDVATITFAFEMLNKLTTVTKSINTRSIDSFIFSFAC
jgi:hypothetical protein